MGGEVDADVEVAVDRAALLPRLGLTKRGTQHLLAERDDETSVLSHRDELDRREQPAGRVIPTHQRLGRDESSRVRIDDGLIEDLELIRRETLTYADLGLESSQRVL